MIPNSVKFRVLSALVFLAVAVPLIYFFKIVDEYPSYSVHVAWKIKPR